MRKLGGAILILLLLAAAAAAFGREETTEELIARADTARRELKSATEAYKSDKMEDFRGAVQQIVKYSDSAHSAALHSGKHLKNTEIKIREIAIRLRDIKLTVEVEEQPPVQAAIDRLEGFRTELLHSMFGSKNND
jgi:hypothetical protein